MNFCENTDKTFNCIVEKTINTDCSDIMTIIIYAENSDRININISGQYSSARYIENGIENTISGSVNIFYNQNLKLVVSVSNSGNQGYFNTANIEIVNNTTSDVKNTYTFSLTRENDAQPCVPLFSGINEFIDLNDTPDSYEGHGGKRVVVKDDETGLEFERIEENLSEFNNDVGFITENDLPSTQNVSTYEDIPLEGGVYYVQFADIDTGAISLDSLTPYILSTSNLIVYRTRVNVVDSYSFIIDKIYRYKKYLGIVRTDIYSGVPQQTPMEIARDLVPKNHLITYSNFSDNYDNFARLEFTLTENIFFEEGLIELPVPFVFIPREADVFLGGDKIDPSFIYIADSDTEQAKVYLSDKDGKLTKSNSLGQNLIMTLKYFTQNQTPIGFKFYSKVRPVTEEFSSNIENRSIVISDSNLTHSNIMKTWVSEYTSNNLTGSAPSMKGFEISNLNQKLSDPLYRLDTMYREDADLLLSALGSSSQTFRNNEHDESVFKIVAHNSNNLVRVDISPEEGVFYPDMIMVTSRAETDNDGTDPLGSSYGFGTEFNEPTLAADLAANGMTEGTPPATSHRQSPATAIVTAKFKWLRNTTGAPWGLIREACRATASNANNYNIYRGFGQIDTAAAKTYIESNIDTWTGVNTTELAEYYDAISPYNTNVSFNDKTDKTVIIKKDLLDYADTVDSDLQDLDNNKVSKSGDTMTGNLIVESRVGIGEVTNPQYLLDIDKGNNNSALFRIRSRTPNLTVDVVRSNPQDIGAAFNIVDLKATNDNTTKDLIKIGALAIMNQGSEPSLNYLYIGKLYNDNALRIYDNNNAYFHGNVGIGVYVPQERLHVNGNVKATQFIGDGSQLTDVNAITLNGHDETNFVKTSGNETITGIKTFEEINVDGNTETDLLTINNINTNATNKAPAVVYNTSNKQVELAQNTVWQSITLTSNVSGTLQYKIINDRMIIIGTVTATSPTSTFIGQLPVGYRPSRNRISLAYSTLGYPPYFNVNDDGSLTISTLVNGSEYTIDFEFTLNIKD